VKYYENGNLEWFLGVRHVYGVFTEIGKALKPFHERNLLSRTKKISTDAHIDDVTFIETS
jgi:hypothetical protein